jgi:hypothetical protein
VEPPAENVVEETEEYKVVEVPTKEKDKPPARITTKKSTTKAKKRFDKYEKLATDGLIKLSIDELRKYATYGLEMVGASKIPGGKTALIQKILKARKK